MTNSGFQKFDYHLASVTHKWSNKYEAFKPYWMTLLVIQFMNIVDSCYNQARLKRSSGFYEPKPLSLAIWEANFILHEQRASTKRNLVITNLIPDPFAKNVLDMTNFESKSSTKEFFLEKNQVISHSKSHNVALTSLPKPPLPQYVPQKSVILISPKGALYDLYGTRMLQSGF